MGLICLQLLQTIKKIIKIKVSLKVSNYILLVTLYIAIFYNLFALPIKFKANSGLSFSYIFAELSLIFIVVSLFFSLFFFSRILLKFWTIFFIVISTIVSYYMMSYHIFIEETIIGTIFETNSTEASAVFSLRLVLFFIVFAVIPLYFFLFKIQIKPLLFNNLKNLSTPLATLKILLLCSFLLGAAYVINPALLHGRYVLKNALSFYTPVNYMSATYLYLYKFSYKKNDVEMVDISKKYNFTLADKKFKNKNINVILVIGESARADHQSLNGYERNTNPHLSKIKNLLSFSKVYSCGTLSRASVTCLLSRKTRANLELPIHESNIISVFNSLGFSSYFFSTQTMYDAKYNFFYLASKDAHKIAFINKIRQNISSNEEVYDEALLKETGKIVSNHENKKLIILYLIGSHLPYNKRYPKKFQKFKPDDGQRNVRSKALTNSYDNTILYTDYVLSQLIEQYKHQNTILYYVSDHGESLGKSGLFYHGAKYEIAPTEQKHIAQFVWVSDSMIKILDKKYANIKKHKDKIITHDYVFHSLLDCIGVESNIIEKKLSICSK